MPRAPAVNVTALPPPAKAPVICKAVEPLFRAKLPPGVKAPRLLMALVAVLRSTAPDEEPVSVPAVIAPAAVCVIAPAFRVTVWPAALTGAVICRAFEPLFSAKSPPAVKAPRLPMALLTVLRSTAPDEEPVSVPAVIGAPDVVEPVFAACVIGPAVRATVLAPTLRKLLMNSGVIPLFSLKSPFTEYGTKVPIALVAVLKSTAPDEPTPRFAAVIVPAAVWVIGPAVRLKKALLPTTPMGPVICRAVEPLFRANSVPAVKAPRLLTALVAEGRITLLTARPVSVLAVRAPLPLIWPLLSSSSVMPLVPNAPATTIEPAVVVSPVVAGTLIAPIRTVLAVMPVRSGSNSPLPVPPSVTGLLGVFGASSTLGDVIKPLLVLNESVWKDAVALLPGFWIAPEKPMVIPPEDCR